MTSMIWNLDIQRLGTRNKSTKSRFVGSLFIQGKNDKPVDNVSNKITPTVSLSYFLY